MESGPSSGDFATYIVSSPLLLPVVDSIWLCFVSLSMADGFPPSVDARTGFDSGTKIYHSLRPFLTLPPLHLPLSAADYAISLLCPSPATPLPDKPAFINASTGVSLTYSEFFRRVRTLSSSLRSIASLSKGDVAYVLAPTSLEIPVLYFSLLSLGVVISPANPLSTASEISRQIALSRPKIAFATSGTAVKLPSLPVILLDSPEFDSMMRVTPNGPYPEPTQPVRQFDPAAILYSSGTTGNFKGVVLTHRNVIAVTAGVTTVRESGERLPGANLFTVPLFHVFGFLVSARSMAMGDTVILMERFDFAMMLKAIEKYKVMYMPVSPPLVVGMVKSPEVDKYDLSSLQAVGCGGAPLGKEMAEKFTQRFPKVTLGQAYGLTETSGGVARTMGPAESYRYGTAGRLVENTEAKIVDAETGEALPPGKQGELWVRGPLIMKGYVGDDEATAATLNSVGWLKTGDLCYFDQDGFLFVVDRLKELIKYKAYQVAPAELEALLQSHPQIADAAVIPYPDEEAGQIPMAYVVRQPGSSLNGSQVADFVAKQVAPYKKIRRVAFINAIPKSAAGKILRRELVKISQTSSISKL
ncbi:4-coumarate--CoA ligase-like 9 [Aristolochia californica]|uniref:4-coumarate--CoA ligase-like 9 n=1 Tax=Aristolochia californica TaxID=171875 RepID=UPI0035DA514C